jgi:hypothetical protein
LELNPFRRFGIACGSHRSSATKQGRTGPTEFRIGVSEQGQGLGVKVTMESAKDAARNWRESKAHGASPSIAERNNQ